MIIDARFIPATADGKPVSTWTDVPLYLGHGVPIGKIPDYSMIPHFDRDYRLNVGPDNYPAESLEMHQEGICAVHVPVTADGTPGDVSLSLSTGFSILDQACVTAVQNAKFVPGFRYGSVVIASTDIFINWRIVSP